MPGDEPQFEVHIPKGYIIIKVGINELHHMKNWVKKPIQMISL